MTNEQDVDVVGKQREARDPLEVFGPQETVSEESQDASHNSRQKSGFEIAWELGH